jgi:hypothetical protein
VKLDALPAAGTGCPIHAYMWPLRILDVCPHAGVSSSSGSRALVSGRVRHQEQLVAKVADFGLACRLRDQDTHVSGVHRVSVWPFGTDWIQLAVGVPYTMLAPVSCMVAPC